MSESQCCHQSRPTKPSLLRGSIAGLCPHTTQGPSGSTHTLIGTDVEIRTVSKRKREVSRYHSLMPCGFAPCPSRNKKSHDTTPRCPVERPQAIIVQGIHVHKVIKREQDDISFRFGERGMKMVVSSSRTGSVGRHASGKPTYGPTSK